MGNDKFGRGSGRAVQLDARAMVGRGAFDEFDSVPQTSCFGLRRQQAAKQRRSEELLQDVLGERVASKQADARQAPQARVSSIKARPRMCGASAILRSFSSIGPEMLVGEGGSGRKVFPSGDDERGSACQATILASYDNILDTKPEAECTASECDRDGDRDDGADSLEEEDTFDTPSFLVDPHDIYFISKGDGTGKVSRLGKGDFGPVYLGVWRDREVAVKLARQKPISLKQERIFHKHVARLHRLDHPNLVQLLGACCWKGGKRTVLVSEYMDKGDLRQLLCREDLTAKFAWVQHGRTVALDIAQGLAALHTRGIVHGRLKSSNVLMNRAGVAKLCDPGVLKLLGHCKDLSLDRTAQPGGKAAATTASIAPEVLCGGEPTMASDIYSFGVVLWELLSMEQPDRRLRSIRTPEEAPAKIAYLVECCLAEDPENRPTAARVVAVISGRR